MLLSFLREGIWLWGFVIIKWWISWMSLEEAVQYKKYIQQKKFNQKNVGISSPPFSSQVISGFRYLNSCTSYSLSYFIGRHLLYMLPHPKLSLFFCPLIPQSPFLKRITVIKKPCNIVFHHIDTTWIHNTLDKYKGSFLSSEFSILSWIN